VNSARKLLIQRLLPVITLFFCGLMTGCSTLTPGFDEPTIAISSFNLAPDEGQGPVFLIGLQIVNPNDKPLKLTGMAYTVNLEGFDILSGAASDLPTVEPYSEATVSISARASLLNSIRLMNRLMQQPSESLHYEFKAKLQVENFIDPIRLTESGTFSMTPQDSTSHSL